MGKRGPEKEEGTEAAEVNNAEGQHQGAAGPLWDTHHNSSSSRVLNQESLGFGQMYQ